MIIEKINKANDIKKLSMDEKKVLAYEIRKFLVEKVSKTGGHLASNLGVVELTIALHSTLDFPNDKLIWDVGHQAYVHKLLTGRKEEFDKLRHLGGMSGFPKRSESPCDVFETGHSATSISAGVGLVRARELRGENHRVISVIGDGSLTGGMAYEALNNAATLKSNFIVVLNDNHMSISQNVGGVSKYLDNLRTAKSYIGLKQGIESALKRVPVLGEPVFDKMKKAKDSMKQLLVSGMFFEDMGIKYLGPVDGHNLNALSKALEEAKRVDGPVLLHVMTTKGKGYIPAERNPSKFHGVAPFDKESGELVTKKTKDTYTDVFGHKLLELASENKNIVAITAAMADGTGLVKFKERFPKRFFDVGIAEEHAVTFAGGLAVGGMVPVVAIYSAFLQRAYDQILHDIAMQNLHVVFAIDRAGLVGQDGETHQGAFDLSYLNSIPNMTIMSPKNKWELEDMLEFAIGEMTGPVAIRYPRGTASDTLPEFRTKIELSKGEVIAEGRDVAIISVGHMFDRALEVCKMLEDKDVSATLINARFVKCMDEELIINAAKTHKLLVTMEENVKSGGFGERVMALLAKNTIEVPLEIIALPDRFIQHGTVAELYEDVGLDSDTMFKRIMNKPIKI